MLENEKIDLVLLLLVVSFLSVYLFFQTYVISLDGAFQYIPIAKDFASGLYKKALSQGQQPLYSLLVAFAYPWTSDWEVAGKLVSSFFGILMIFPVYLLGKQIFDRKVAFVSTLFLAIHPYIRRFSGDVLKESTYLFFLAIAMLFAWWTLRRERKRPYLFIPLFSAIAYLVRPDGIEVLLVVFIYILLIKKFNSPGEKWTVVSLLVLSSVIFFLPYLLHVRETTGVWTLSKAKTVQGIFSWEMMRGEGPYIKRIVLSFWGLNSGILTVYHPLYIFLLIVGLWKRGSSRLKTGDGFLISLFILHYGVLFLLASNLITERGENKTLQAALFSGRHVLPLLLISIFWVGEGFGVIFHWVDKKVASYCLSLGVAPKRKSTLLWVTLLILVSVVVLPKTLKPQRYERLTEKWAGMWIKNESGKEMTIFTSLPRVAFYAEGNCEYIDVKKEIMDSIKASMVKKGAIYLVLREREVLGHSEMVEPIRKDFDEAMRYEEKGMEEIIIYRLAKGG